MILYMQDYYAVRIQITCTFTMVQDRLSQKRWIQRGYEAVKRTNACVMGMPSKDTVKLADSSGYIKETPDRKIVWNIQTPQIFSYDLIRGSL